MGKRMLSMLFAAVITMQSAPAAAEPCSAVPGAESLWRSPEARFVIVGERHGTTEAPAAFGDLVCLASREGPVAVGVEAGQAFVQRLDAFMNSDREGSALASFLSDPLWNRTLQDGRSSQAMLDMFKELRQLRRAGADVSVFGFQPEGARRPEGFDQSYYELEMAQLLSRGAQASPRARVLVLVGDLHAQKTGFSRWGGGLPAAGHLSPKHVISLLVTTAGGTAWNCQGPTAADCKSSPVHGSATSRSRGVVLSPQMGGAYDGVLSVGPVTASPPAAR
jgi:hypothetical protein